MSRRTGLLAALILGAAALAYGIGTRLSTETINILVGVMCGIAASVPVSLGLLIALTREREAPTEEEDEVSGYPERISPYPPRASQPPYPPVIVVAPPQSQLPGPYGGYLPPGNMREPPMTRDFKIIGDDEDDFQA